LIVTDADFTTAPFEGEEIALEAAYAVPGMPKRSEPPATEAATVSTPSLRMVVTA